MALRNFLILHDTRLFLPDFAREMKSLKLEDVTRAFATCRPVCMCVCVVISLECPIRNRRLILSNEGLVSCRILCKFDSLKMLATVQFEG